MEVFLFFVVVFFMAVCAGLALAVSLLFTIPAALFAAIVGWMIGYEL